MILHLQGRSDQMIGKTKGRILALMPATWTELLERAGVSDPTLCGHLNDLQEKGWIRKKGGKYQLTEDGRAVLRRSEEGKLAQEESTAADELVDDGLDSIEDTIMKGLRVHGTAMDLEKDRGVLKVIASGGILAFKDLFKTYVLDSLGKEYLQLLTSLYINSVRNFLGMEGTELKFEDLRAAWLAADPAAWKDVDEREGLAFDFSSAWRKSKKNLSHELKEKMTKHGLDKYSVFARLRTFSFPTLERIKLARRHPERIVDPPYKENKGGEKPNG